MLNKSIFLKITSDPKQIEISYFLLGAKKPWFIQSSLQGKTKSSLETEFCFALKDFLILTNFKGGNKPFLC